MSEYHKRPFQRSPANRLTTLACILAITVSTAAPAFASGVADPAYVVADVLVARPISVGVAAGGAALFVLVLPFAAASRSVKTASDTLLVAPAKDLFTRPVGDLNDWLSY